MERLSSLLPGTTLLTVNRRLAAHLREEHADEQERSGATVWRTPDIVPINSWMRQCWLALLNRNRPLHHRPFPLGELEPVQVQTLLTPMQERTLWQRIIEESGDHDFLLRPDAAAGHAMEAWHLLHGWRVEGWQRFIDHDPDCATFHRWAEQYHTLCRKQGWLDQAGLPDLLTDVVEHLPLPDGVMLAGFDDISPQISTLLDALSRQGVAVSQLSDETISATAVRLPCSDPISELRLAALWSRRRLITHQQNPRRDDDARKRDPMTIAIVVPDLAGRRAEVARVMRQHLHPGSSLESRAPERPLFNISMGERLSDYPLVADALLILKAIRSPLDVAGYGRLLTSPFLAGGQREWSNRCSLDATLRRLGQTHLSLTTLRTICRRLIRFGRPIPPCPILERHLDQFLTLVDTLESGPVQRPGSAWATLLSQLLEAMGWPGERTLESTEYQTVEAWRNALSTLTGLERIDGGLWTLSDALEHLSRIIRETTFQPQSPQAPVQVLGTLEAAGEKFDALWVMGMTDDRFPGAPSPNPLLPWPLQRQHSLPRATAERERLFAERVVNRLKGAAPLVIFSHAEMEEDRALSPTPLIMDLPTPDGMTVATETLSDLTPLLTREAIHHPPLPLWLFQQAQATPVVEWVALDTHAPPLSKKERENPVYGGSGVLKAQAACPFQAVMHYRLRSEPLDEPQPTLTPLERGTVVHTALHRLGAWIKDSETLATHSEEEGRVQIEQIAREVIDAERPALKSRGLSTPFLKRETLRLQTILERWLTLERGRELPFTIAHRESALEAKLAGITFSIRADRIDKLEDGSHLLLDYKTAATLSAKSWFGPRPEEPQLPLYAIALEQRVSAIAFAQTRPESSRFIGIADREEYQPGIRAWQALMDEETPESWQKVLDGWKETLISLAEAYGAGAAPVDPRPKACDHCPYPAICRIFERGVA
ncbi:MAG: PD-(D/E)XK nuclease family protein [Magnetococcales bacterium]|nr:PD-(D/E)XK nuclease family protein [Magnetococcales bacterium]